MDSLERFQTAMALGQPDIPPIFYQHFGAGEWILRDLGMTMKQAHEHPENIVKCQARARKAYGHDNLIAGWGCYVEAHALGSLWSWENKSYYYPRITKYRVTSQDDLSSLSVPDPREDHMMRTYIEALRLMNERYGANVPVLGFVNSPLIAAEELRGCEALFIDTIINPSFYEKLLNIVTETNVRYVTSMIEESGVLGILIEDGSMGMDQLSREQAKKINLPYTAQLVDWIKNKHRWAIIHNCSSQPYLDLHASLLPNAIDFWIKAKVDPVEVKRDLKGICISTGVDAVSDMVMEKPACVERSVLDSYREYGLEGGFLISTGAEIPLSAPVENVWAIKRAAEKCV
jgi:uroporphyrinogen decarboxylase